jgi:LEA14-like dessication related protein
MSFRTIVLSTLLVATTVTLGGCASFEAKDPVQVFMVGMEPLPSEGMELRFAAKLRVQNPNDELLEFDGVSIQVHLQGKKFATGVGPVTGSVPRFGETVIDVPVSVSLFRIANQVLSVANKDFNGKVTYEISGKLSRSGSSSVRFKSSGEIDSPTGASGAEQN